MSFDTDFDGYSLPVRVPRKGEVVSEVTDRLTELHNVLGGVLDASVIQGRFKGKQPPSGNALRWEHSYNQSGPAFTYLALRVGPRWYLTGSTSEHNRVMDWQELQEFIGDSKCYLVTKYKEIPQLPKDPVDSAEDPDSWFDAVFPNTEDVKSADDI